MIKCVYEKSKSGVKLTVNGHAGYAQHGEDIVCSAVSALTETLIARLLELNAKFSYKKEPGAVEVAMQRAGALSRHTGDMSVAEDGKMQSVLGDKKAKGQRTFGYNQYEKANEAFHFAVLGMQLIATAYPKNVEVQRMELKIKS